MLIKQVHLLAKKGLQNAECLFLSFPLSLSFYLALSCLIILYIWLSPLNKFHCIIKKKGGLNGLNKSFFILSKESG